MTIDQAQHLRQQLSDDIFHAIIDFEKQTNLVVKDVSIVRSNFNCSLDDIVQVKVDVEL